ncbi:MAG TPA: MotA/TolQ/ExbB proton channel family protein, partial [Telluria sp.]
ERADLLARIPPMLGLMATIIPLGPGLAALGKGDPAQLASAVTVAFDATVLGLVAGIGGLVIGKLRRRWYEETLEAMEAAA